MNIWKLLAAATLVSSIAVPAAHAGDYDEFTAAKHKVVKINMTVCSSVRVYVEGDGRTDLDFGIKDLSGRVIHDDDDATSWTVKDIDRDSSAGCTTYRLYVRNLGGVASRFSVTMIDLDESGEPIS